MNDTFSKCIEDRRTSYVPVWFMRQVGRYLPEFREIRTKNPNFIKLCLNPKLVNEITLQPLKRFNLDAAIIFSDILMVPYGLGQGVKFEKGIGPILENINLENIIKTNPVDFIKKLLPVYKGIEEVKKSINKKDLIGFVGAPWTLLLYMLHKESPKNNFDLVISLFSLDYHYDFNIYFDYLKKNTNNDTVIIFDTIRYEYFKKVFKEIEIIKENENTVHKSKRVACKSFKI